MTDYRELTYLSAASELLSKLQLGERRVWSVKCPRRGTKIPRNCVRAAISRVSKDLGIKVATFYDKTTGEITIRRIK